MWRSWVRPSWVSAVVFPVPDAPLMITPRRAETWWRLSWINSRLVGMVCRIVGVLTSGRSQW